MDQQQPYGSGDVPPQGTQDGPPQGYAPQQNPYSSPYQQPPPQQPIQGGYSRGRVPFARFFTTDKVIQFMVIGLLFMFIGALCITMVSTSDGPKSYDSKYDDDDNGVIDTDKWDNYYDDLRFYTAMKDIGTIIGRILVSFGTLMLVIVLFGGGIINHDLDKYVRIGMIIAAGLIVGWSGFL